VIRAAILISVLFLAPAIIQAQAVDPDAEKLSNDQPTRPLQMPAASSEAKEAFEDFERFKRRGSWERATKALYAIPEAQATRFVDGVDGFIIPVARKRRAVLAGLSPEGLAAYRLFHDADAKKLFDKAEGPTEQATLEKLFSAYFLTSIGDNAADRLGDLYFEQGQFDRAADCWLAVFRERSDSELSPALMAVKAALALEKAGRRAECTAIRDELGDRYADEVVTLGNKKAKALDHLKAILGNTESPRKSGPSGSSGDIQPPTLADAVPASWQLRFGESVTAGMTPPETTQWEANSLSFAVPRVAIEGSTLFANYLGHVFALDLKSGKMLWRSGSFHNLEVNAQSNQNRMIEPTRYAVLAAPGYVWSLGRDLKDMNMMAGPLLICRRAETGDVIWQSKDIADYAGIELAGLPILARDLLLIAGKSSANNNARRQTRLEDRGRHVPPGPAVLLLLHEGYDAPAPAVLPGRVGLPRHPPRHPGPARRRVGRPGLGVWLPDRAGQGAKSVLFLGYEPERGPDADEHAAGRDRRLAPGQRGQGRPDLRDRS